jgi:Uma2 family endonuclease
VCGPVERDLEDPLSAVNPTLLVEVLSESTARYDRGAKFEHYKKLQSLQQYVLVSHAGRSVEVWTRGAGDAWSSRVTGEGDEADLSSVGARIDVRELYDAAAEPGA